MSWFESPTILVTIVAAVAIIVSVASSIFAVVWMLGKWTGTVDERLKPLASFGEWKGKVDERLRGFEERLKEFGEQLEAFRRDLFGQRTVKTNSPASLTEYGEKLSAFLRAKEWAARTATIVLSEVVNKRPFEIEDFSRGYVTSRLDSEMADQVAACAYDFGIVDLDSVRSVLWIVLRDELIQRAEQAKG